MGVAMDLERSTTQALLYDFYHLQYDYIALQQVTEAVVIFLVLEETGKLRPHLISKRLGQLHALCMLLMLGVVMM